METFIPILIAIIIFAFQAYANFQKEQEKARKRNLGQPPLPEENAQWPVEEEYWSEPVLDPAPVPHDIPVQPQQSSESKYQAFERYSGVVDSAETKRISKASQRQQPPRLVKVDEGTTPAAVAGEVTFDLRDAVIKSAILERPYS